MKRTYRDDKGLAVTDDARDLDAEITTATLQLILKGQRAGFHPRDVTHMIVSAAMQAEAEVCLCMGAGIDLSRLEAKHGVPTEGEPEPSPFTREIPEYGDLYPLDDFMEMVRSGGFIDYDGHGHASDGAYHAKEYVYPSHFGDRLHGFNVDLAGLPEGTTHIIWFNK